MTTRSPPNEESERWFRSWRESGDKEALNQFLALEVSGLKEQLSRRAPAQAPDFGASDALQEAFPRVQRSVQPTAFDSPRALRAYLWRAAWNLLLDRLPDHPTLQLDDVAHGDSGGGPSTSGGFSSVDRREMATALRFTLTLLEPEEQQIIDLVYFQGLGLDAVAARLGIGEDAAARRRRKAFEKLRRLLGSWSELIG